MARKGRYKYFYITAIALIAVSQLLIGYKYLVRWAGTDAMSILAASATYYHSRLNGQLPTKKDLLLRIPKNELKTRFNQAQNFGY
jgi:hypothetical protein